LIDSGRVYTCQFETYHREIERYGGELGLEQSERIFHADSESVLDALDAGDSADERWLIALIGVDRLLADFGMLLPEKMATMGGMCRAYRVESKANSLTKKRLGEKFRVHRKTIDLALEGEGSEAIVRAQRSFDRRSERLREIVKELERLESERRIDRSIREIMPSYIHMHVDRVIDCVRHLRMHELVIYDLLHRIYESRIARGRVKLRPS
jgi:lantibiotic biosynthesis protein